MAIRITHDAMTLEIDNRVVATGRCSCPPRASSPLSGLADQPDRLGNAAVTGQPVPGQQPGGIDARDPVERRDSLPWLERERHAAGCVPGGVDDPRRAGHVGHFAVGDGPQRGGRLGPQPARLAVQSGGEADMVGIPVRKIRARTSPRLLPSAASSAWSGFQCPGSPASMIVTPSWPVIR